MQLSTNTLLQGGKYRIERVLGQGGFGITYLGTQVALNRKVAIKEFFMKEYCNRDSETSHVSVPSEGSKELVKKFRNKFIKEAQTIAEMDNHHIIRIHDVFEEHGTAYYVMEYLAGGDLRSRIPKHGMAADEALGYIRQIADALKYIHTKNILHLDIKPSNIMFRHDDEAVLIDFGISKHYDDDGGGQTSSTPVGISEGYAPTEQYDREEISSFSAATDIYSLGATLYCLLNGSRPPKASVVLNEGLPALPDKVPAAIRQAVEKAMAPRRKDRPQSVAEFMALLNSEEEEGTVVEEETDVKPEPKPQPTPKPKPTPTPDPKPSPWKKWAVPLAVSVIAALAVVFWPKGGDDNSGEGPGTDSVTTVVTDTTHSRPIDKPVDYIDRINNDEKVEPEETPAPSQLYVTTSPSGATVYVDGKRIGTTPIKGKEIERGRHTVKITKDGYETFSDNIQFGDKPIVLNETLEAEEKETPAPPKLDVTTTPSGGTVYIDGKRVGTTPIKGMEVESGSHTVKIIKDGYETFSDNIQFDNKPVVYDVTVTLKEKEKPTPITTGTINGYKYVDLGLSVKWADRNVGANSPSDYGIYFAWGETSKKPEYWDSNSVTYEKNFSDIAGNSSYDAARANWGSSWRLPTKAECEELNKKCTWTWTTQGGHNGYKVTGPNGNSIFLPAADSWYGTSATPTPGEYGRYWSSTPYESNTQYAYSLYFDSGLHSVSWYNRYYGFTVRPVSD